MASDSARRDQRAAFVLQRHQPQVSTDAFAALTRATSLVAEGLSEEQLTQSFAQCACDGSAADLCAIYVRPDQAQPAPAWRLAASIGLDDETATSLPFVYGNAPGFLAPVFQSSRELLEPDLLEGAGEQPPGRHLPSRSLAGLPIRRRDGRVLGVLLVGAIRPHAFDECQPMLRSLAQLLGLGLDNARLRAAQQRERRMAAESALTLDTVLESVGSGVCVVRLDGTLRVANKTLQELFGFPALTPGMSLEEAFASASVQPRETDAFRARLRELVAEPGTVDESEWELATDPPRMVKRHAAPMRNHVGEVIGHVEVFTEITEERRLYTQLLNSERLRGIGEMASGVAHDFNNLLASIVGQTDLLHPDDLGAGTQQAITTIRQAALDGARMVRGLQGLARPRIESPSKTADLNETVKLAVEMARPRWAGAALHGRASIDVSLHLADDSTLARVAIDPSELREVLLNLLFNATDAMPDGGRIDITTRPSRTPESADLEVRDTGQGMPESVRARIFEPFFSTKGAKGSGLGLAVAYSIISRCGGEIRVDSEVGTGTTFTLQLPYVPTAAASQSAEAPGLPEASASERRATTRPAAANPAQVLKGARILVADDEPGLVTIVRQLMERSGARVTIANGGRAALEALKDPSQAFDVVITDLDMPEVDGWSVTAEAKARRSDVRVVMLTGWAGEIAPEDFSHRGVDVVLGKPCSRSDLESAISQLLTPPAQADAALQVLVVDDEPVFARSIRDLLKLQGHQVETVDSAAAALEALAGRQFDAVLTDYSLGEVTGAQLAERLADIAGARPQGERSPFVVLITGYATEVDDPSLRSRGVDAVLPKPCRGEDLRSVLARVPSR